MINVASHSVFSAVVLLELGFIEAGARKEFRSQIVRRSGPHFLM
jgi:hypothetical protein